MAARVWLQPFANRARASRPTPRDDVCRQPRTCRLARLPMSCGDTVGGVWLRAGRSQLRPALRLPGRQECDAPRLAGPGIGSGMLSLAAAVVDLKRLGAANDRSLHGRTGRTARKSLIPGGMWSDTASAEPALAARRASRPLRHSLDLGITNGSRSEDHEQHPMDGVADRSKEQPSAPLGCRDRRITTRWESCPRSPRKRPNGRQAT